MRAVSLTPDPQSIASQLEPLLARETVADAATRAAVASLPNDALVGLAKHFGLLLARCAGLGDAMGWVPTSGGRHDQPVTLADVATQSDQIDFTLYSHGYGRPAIRSGVGLRHNGKANILFVDGHVDAVTGDQAALGRCLLLPLPR